MPIDRAGTRPSPTQPAVIVVGRIMKNPALYTDRAELYDAISVERFEERHVLRLYDQDFFTRIFEESGFSLSIENPGLNDDRELLACRKA
jgi:hypothetical protein